jgi:uncharacterized membrane protein YbaN (DUF454 family)
MTQPTSAGLTVDPEYSARDTPMTVRVWEQQVAMSATAEAAAVQMLYVNAVQTYKLRITVNWMIGVMAGMFLLGVLIWVLVLART